MSELSPQAQAVDRAIATRLRSLGEAATPRHIAAAALRAASSAIAIDLAPHTMEHAQVWSALLDIALELENNND